MTLRGQRVPQGVPPPRRTLLQSKHTEGRLFQHTLRNLSCEQALRVSLLPTRTRAGAHVDWQLEKVLKCWSYLVFQFGDKMRTLAFISNGENIKP